MGCFGTKEKPKTEPNKQQPQASPQKVNEFSVTIILENGSQITINTHDKMTVQSLKQEIQKKHHITVEKQKLLFNNSTLDNSKTVGSYQIQKDSELKLIEMEEPMNMHHNLKFGENSDEIEITVCDVNNQVSNFKISKNSKIYDLKKLIFEKTGTQIQQQQFFFQGAILEDQKTIHDQNIKNLSNIQLNFINQGGSVQQQWDLSYVIKKN